MRTVQSRVSLGAAAAVVTTVAILASLGARSAYNSRVQAGSSEALAQSKQQGGEVKSEIDRALTTARALASALAAVKDPGNPQPLTRDQVTGMLRQVATRTPSIVGVYTAWEPNAFDAKDAEFAGKPGHDSTGRFLPYLVRSSRGDVTLEPLADLESQERGPTGVRKGEYYLCAKEASAECVTNPYPYPIDGKVVLLTSLVAPIMVNGRFSGIAGVDIQLGTLQEQVDRAQIAGGRGQVVILSNNGRVIAARNRPELAGQPIAQYRDGIDSTVLAAVLQGSQPVSHMGEELVALTSIQVGATRTPWAVATLVPYNLMMASARSTALQQAGIGAIVGLIAVAVVVLFVVRGIKDVLLGAVADLSQNSSQVSSAAAQVSSASEALAQGASEQAAAIEEMSASATEVQSMALRNAENAREASSLMSKSLSKISDANGRLGQLITAMDAIQDSSHRISKINRTIDEIAFQTNILALNAAVEAARAGGSGLGFAVVADEVRTLAQRSAQAAKETSALIEESMARAKDGQVRVNEVAEAIKAITTESGAVRELVDAVNLGSQEQTRGIEQISQAISQMERVTQTAAAGAEECASASQEMSSQALEVNAISGHLGELVGVKEGQA